jgi:hypothetical protein
MKALNEPMESSTFDMSISDHVSFNLREVNNNCILIDVLDKIPEIHDV